MRKKCLDNSWKTRWFDCDCTGFECAYRFVIWDRELSDNHIPVCEIEVPFRSYDSFFKRLFKGLKYLFQTHTWFSRNIAGKRLFDLNVGDWIADDNILYGDTEICRYEYDELVLFLEEQYARLKDGSEHNYRKYIFSGDSFIMSDKNECILKISYVQDCDMVEMDIRANGRLPFLERLRMFRKYLFKYCDGCSFGGHSFELTSRDIYKFLVVLKKINGNYW